MARRSSQLEAPQAELDLLPILNMVMILMPLLMVMLQFEEFAISPVEATSSGGAASGDSEETERPPRIMVSISTDGFRVADFFGSPDFASFAAPLSRCGGAGAAGEGAAPPTVCLEQGKTPEPGDYSGLDYAGLYNRLLEIRMHEPWRELYAVPENGVLLITAESDTPAAVVVRTMDLTRYFLNPSGDAGLANPIETGASDLSAYYLGGAGDAGTREDLLNAQFYMTDGADGLNRHPDGTPSNILAMFPTVSLVAPR